MPSVLSVAHRPLAAVRALSESFPLCPVPGAEERCKEHLLCNAVSSPVLGTKASAVPDGSPAHSVASVAGCALCSLDC